MGKEILVLLGSDSDKGKVLPKIEEVFEETAFDYTCKLASSHRTPELVAERIHEKGYDGVITAGGLSLILTADTIREVEKGRKDRNSKYYGRWTPVIGVPLYDSDSKGLSALLSIQETPSGYPAPTVGIDRADTAARCMKNILRNKYKEIKVFKDELSAGLAKKVLETFKKLNVEAQDGEIDISINGLNIVCYLDNNYLESIEATEETPFYIAVINRGADVIKYPKSISGLTNCLHTKIGSADNAAILATQILSLNNPSLLDAIDSYREEGRKKYYEV